MKQITNGFTATILIWIIVVVLLIGGGIYYWQKQKITVKPQPSPSQQPAATPTVPETIIPPQQSTATSSVFTVGPNGGTIVFPDGKTEITFSKGALTSATTVEVYITNEVAAGQVGPLYGIDLPHLPGSEFLKPITLEINYDPKLLPAAAIESKTVIGKLGPLISWEELNSSVDTVHHTIAATTTETGSFGVLYNSY